MTTTLSRCVDDDIGGGCSQRSYDSSLQNLAYVTLYIAVHDQETEPSTTQRPRKVSRQRRTTLDARFRTRPRRWGRRRGQVASVRVSSFLRYSIHFTSDRLSELLELRRLRKARQGIDVHKLSSGDVKKKRRRNAEEAAEEQGGLRPGAGSGSGSGSGAAAGAGPGAKTEDE